MNSSINIIIRITIIIISIFIIIIIIIMIFIIIGDHGRRRPDVERLRAAGRLRDLARDTHTNMHTHTMLVRRYSELL